MLRKIIENVSSNYDFIVIDTEAGLEHLSRRTTQSVDTMLVVSDSSRRGLQTASRVGKLAKDLEISFKNLFLILNKVKTENEDELIEQAKDTGIELAGIIYDDEIIAEFDLKGKALIGLPDDSKPVLDVGKILNKILEK
jgi:CO dehydrogenase maturation factor